MYSNQIPSFGPLQGVKVVHLTTSIAGPFCAQRMADFGADVIWIENPKSLDFMRRVRWGVEIERRNQRSLSLDVPSEEGRKVFARLLKDTDILIDSFRGGQMAKWGLSDEMLWEINPKLIIVHISGFGQSGIPEYYEKASYDPIAQAYGCYMIMNGYPDRKPVPAFPSVADYTTGLFAANAALAALYRVQKSGVGESIDAAQFETLMGIMGVQVSEYLNTGALPIREGSHSAHSAGYGAYTCQDGVDVYMLLVGGPVIQKALPILGLSFGDEIPKGTVIVMLGTPGGDLIEEAVQRLCDSMPAAEIEKLLCDNGIPCGRIFDYNMAVQDPHYQARQVFIEWENTHGDKIKGINVFPKLKNNPGKVWRGLMNIGEDTDDILDELGYKPEEIENFRLTKITGKK